MKCVEPIKCADQKTNALTEIAKLCNCFSTLLNFIDSRIYSFVYYKVYIFTFIK